MSYKNGNINSNDHLLSIYLGLGAFNKNGRGGSGDLQDGRGVRHGDQLPLHKYIRNTSACGTTPTEHLLNAGRRPQTSQKVRNSPRPCVGQKKKERKE